MGLSTSVCLCWFIIYGPIFLYVYLCPWLHLFTQTDLPNPMVSCSDCAINWGLYFLNGLFFVTFLMVWRRTVDVNRICLLFDLHFRLFIFAMFILTGVCLCDLSDLCKVKITFLFIFYFIYLYYYVALYIKSVPNLYLTFPGVKNNC